MAARIGKYTLTKKIADGRFAKVYAAKDNDGISYAFKAIYPQQDSDLLALFCHEIEINMRVQHPQIVPIVDYWYEDKVAYLVMPYLDGGDLAQKLAKDGAFDLLTAAHVLKQIADALHFVHRQNVCHQDIKPENIVFDQQGNAYLIDFGMARDLSGLTYHSQTQNQIVSGSPRYISPEQLKLEQVTHRSDIYSLGLLMYEMLTAYPAYSSNQLEDLFRQHLCEPVPSLQSRVACLPLALNHAIRYASHKDPAERYASVLDFARDVMELALQAA